MRKLQCLLVLVLLASTVDAGPFRRRGVQYNAPPQNYYAVQPAPYYVAPEPVVVATTTEAVTEAATADESTDALDEVNAARAARGLRPYVRDEGLTTAAVSAARFRAARLIEAHTPNDFGHVPSGSSATAAGCAAWEPSWGWGSCCTYEGWTYAGAAWVRGRDGRRYMHLFVK